MALEYEWIKKANKRSKTVKLNKKTWDNYILFIGDKLSIHRLVEWMWKNRMRYIMQASGNCNKEWLLQYQKNKL